MQSGPQSASPPLTSENEGSTGQDLNLGEEGNSHVTMVSITWTYSQLLDTTAVCTPVWIEICPAVKNFTSTFPGSPTSLVHKCQQVIVYFLPLLSSYHASDQVTTHLSRSLLVTWPRTWRSCWDRKTLVATGAARGGGTWGPGTQWERLGG